MSVKLVSLTTPCQELQELGVKTAEDLIVYCARVSNPANQFNTETGARLLRYLIKNKHWSPFEMATMTVEVKTSRAIAAQLLRHRSFSFQEFSQRYSIASSLEPIEWRMQGATNRQVGDVAVALDDKLNSKIAQVQHACTELYNDLVAMGVAKECARMVLPLNTSSTLYVTGNIRSWLTYLNVRLHSTTQKEHREEIAVPVRDILCKEFPVIAETFANFKEFDSAHQI